MFDLLDKLRAEPEENRRAVALGAAGAVTLLIGAAWLSNLSIALPSAEHLAAPAATPGPLQVIADQMSDLFSRTFPQ